MRREIVIVGPKETPELRTLRCRIAAKSRWTKTSQQERVAQMAKVREGLLVAKFRREHDPEGTLPPDEFASRLKDFRELEALKAKYQSAKKARASKAADPPVAADESASETPQDLSMEEGSR